MSKNALAGPYVVQETARASDIASRDDLIRQYTPLIKYIASRIAMRLPPNVVLDDLISAGVIGLIDAIEKYDATRNTQFKTYAEFRIKGAILDELRSLDWVPRSVRKKFHRIEAAYAKLQKESGRPATDEEVAGELGVDMEEFHRLLEASRSVSLLSLDGAGSFAVNLSRDDVMDAVASTKQDDPAEALGLSELRDEVAKAIESLPTKERYVVSLYYYEELTMKEIGEVMGYTESRISQMHTKAVFRLRAKLREYFEEL
ncbi:MAG: FliA/WhiG family RNA polymerase sigma factor [Pseudomonadota bacterium]